MRRRRLLISSSPYLLTSRRGVAPWERAGRRDHPDDPQNGLMITDSARRRQGSVREREAAGRACPAGGRPAQLPAGLLLGSDADWDDSLSTGRPRMTMVPCSTWTACN